MERSRNSAGHLASKVGQLSIEAILPVIFDALADLVVEL
ncbi:hypothetical protein R69749_07910 [Paraburkholderia domus]|jgi:hypothetical protein|nr:hypothetical protein R69619_07615 [Paraburkholderia nemoris]CAE6896532.1 hypothetical protein R69749_07910 [Paraburkholderia domus]